MVHSKAKQVQRMYFRTIMRQVEGQHMEHHVSNCKIKYAHFTIIIRSDFVFNKMYVKRI